MHSILHSTSAPMRFTSGRSWVSQFCFEPRESWQGTTPSVTWSVDVLPQLEPPWQRANRFVTHRRKKAHGRAASLYAGTWRSYALWPNHTSLGPHARQVLQRTCRFSQRGKICHHWKRILLCAHRGRNHGPDEHVGMPTVCQSVKKDLLGVRRWHGRSFSVTESFGAGAALQRCIVTLHLASHWLHGLMICTQLCIILILNSLGNISTEGKKIIINDMDCCVGTALGPGVFVSYVRQFDFIPFLWLLAFMYVPKISRRRPRSVCMHN